MGTTGEHDGQEPVSPLPGDAKREPVDEASFDGESEFEDESDLDDSFLREVASVPPRAQFRTLLPGERLGGSDGRRFEIIDQLGEGTMGQVFRARDEELQRVVALKFLFPREELAGMGLREARAIAQLDHENIIRIFDVSEWRPGQGAAPVPFLVMECLQGESLADLLKREPKLELRHTLRLMREVAAGLAHAHEHQIIHRDLKPSNVFLTHQGPVKLLDFGLAWRVHRDTTSVPQELPSAGTPSHMAPEQWRGEDVDERSDIWAAGVMLYELLTGELPYPESKVDELRTKVLSPQPVPSLRECSPELPGELESLLAVALSKDPGKRLLSADELHGELLELEEHLRPGGGGVPRSVAPQRRQVTLVSCRLARLSTLAEQLDPEDFSELEATFHRAASEVLQRHGGFITLCIGDEVLACFGYPVVKEGDSECAVRAGLALPLAVQEALRERQPLESSAELAVQVGIDTDLVVLDDISPELRGRTPTIQGLAPRIAAWLGRQAGPDQVVLGPTTYRLVKRAFDTVPLGTRSFDGRRNLEVHRVLRSRVAVIRFERTLAGEGKLSPLVGRERELAVLLDTWRRTLEGLGSYVLVCGEAGIGKSRLLQELRERVLPEKPLMLRLQCWSQFSSSALHPVIEVLQRLWLRPELSPQENLQTLTPMLEGRGLTPVQVGLLASLLSLPVAEDSPHLRLTPQRQQEEIMAALAALAMRQEWERPVLVVVEDLHWADPSTLRLLSFLLELVDKLRVLLVLSARPEFRSPWGQHPRVQLLALERLSAAYTEQLIKEVARGQRLPDKVVTQLVARTDGVPLFVEELTRVILEGETAAIPLTLQELLLARLDTLPRRQQQLAQLCAVVGRSFSQALLLSLTGLADSALRRDLSALVAAGLLQPGDEEAETSFQFRHALIQEAALQSLPRVARRQYHQRIAQALEERPVKPAGILAYHYLAAHDEAKGLEYTLIAARAAKRQYANDEAIHHYRRALEVLSSAEHLPRSTVLEDTGQVRLELAQTLLQSGNYTDAIQMFTQRLENEHAAEVRAELHVGLGRAFQEKGESSRAIQELERALELMGHAAPRTRAALVARTVAHLGLHLLSHACPWVLRPVPEPNRELFIKQLNTLVSLIRIYYFVDLSKLTWATLVALNMAGRVRTEYGLSHANGYYGTVLFGAGLLRGSLHHLSLALEHGRRSHDAVAEGIALSRLGTHALFTNDLDRAVQLEQEAIGVLRQVGERWEMQTFTMILATSHFLAARFELAEQSFREMGEMGLALNALRHQGWSHSWVPMCRYLRGEGDVAQVCEQLEKGLEISLQVNDLANQCAALNHLANVFVRENLPEEAAQISVRAFNTVWKYQVMVPFLQIGLVDAVEAALFALEQGATSVPRSKLLRIVRLGTLKARALAFIYPYLKGPALRVAARARRLRKGPAAAEPLFLRAISVLEKSPNRWELGVAYLDAAVALPHRRARFLARAREVFTAIGAQAELRRVSRLERQVPEYSPAGQRTGVRPGSAPEPQPSG